MYRPDNIMTNSEYSLRQRLIRAEFRARSNITIGFFLGLAVGLAAVFV